MDFSQMADTMQRFWGGAFGHLASTCSKKIPFLVPLVQGLPSPGGFLQKMTIKIRLLK